MLKATSRSRIRVEELLVDKWAAIAALKALLADQVDMAADTPEGVVRDKYTDLGLSYDETLKAFGAVVGPSALVNPTSFTQPRSRRKAKPQTNEGE